MTARGAPSTPESSRRRPAGGPPAAAGDLGRTHRRRITVRYAGVWTSAVGVTFFLLNRPDTRGQHRRSARARPHHHASRVGFFTPPAVPPRRPRCARRQRRRASTADQSAGRRRRRAARQPIDEVAAGSMVNTWPTSITLVLRRKRLSGRGGPHRRRGPGCRAVTEAVGARPGAPRATSTSALLADRARPAVRQAARGRVVERLVLVADRDHRAPAAAPIGPLISAPNSVAAPSPRTRCR
jgi:hypothetical protein